MKNKITLTKAKKRANTAFSIYIRTRDAIKTTGGTEGLLCFTCGKWYLAFGKGCAQCGHFIPGRHSAILYDERNAHGQCYNCNVNLKGNWVKYEDKMIEVYGSEVVAELKELDKTNPHLKTYQYLEIESEYKERVRSL